MKRGLLVVILALQFFSLRASHIVGGEFEIIALGNYRYKINLIIYFDEINGLPGNKQQDAIITARIFRYADGAAMRDVSLPWLDESNVPYTNDACTIGELKTSRMFYSTEITMSPEIFNHPQGYYIVWERCCRNYNITNIFSAPPDVNPANAAGQTFYLKFPPVVMNGEPFVNSSPILFPPLTDYGCTSLPYYKDFTGTDNDGDSLVYSMVTPLSTHSSDAYPPILPLPYPEVKWQSGFGLDNIIMGSPDLRISSDGLLTVTPQFTGLYVFAVMCEEFRDGVKIGEVRRDFQMLVRECTIPDAPVIVGKKKLDANYSSPNQPLTVSFANTVQDDDRCIRVRISDTDSEKSTQNFQEKVSIRIIPISFKTGSRTIPELLPSVHNKTLTNGSTAEFDVCLPQCSYIPNSPYVIGIVASDDACSLPLSDTLIVTVFVQNPVNNKAQFTTDVAIDTTLKEGDSKIWQVDAVDADNDPLIVGVLTDGFVLADYGMSFEIEHQENGLLDARLVWDAKCDVYDFSQKTEFNITIIVDDIDKCVLADPDFSNFDLKIKLPGNSDPIISTNLVANPSTRRIEVSRKVFEEIDFDVLGTDADGDLLVLSGSGVDFNASNLGATFRQVTDDGEVQSPFHWAINCDNVDLAEKDQYDFQFIVVDNANKCRLYKADTLDVVVNVQPPDNLAPELTIVNNNPKHTFADNALTTVLGEGPIQLTLFGSDDDTSPAKDKLNLQLVEADGNVPPEGYKFNNVEGESVLQGNFTWDTDCAMFRDGIFENTYNFTFIVTDGKCFNTLTDTLYLDITVKDVEQHSEEFLPMNFVSPNGDGKNDFFSMEDFEINPGDEVEDIDQRTLPADNCISKFVRINIYDRWGKEVYASSARDFRWYPDYLSVGIYYYYLVYSDRTYRGAVTVKY